MSSDDNGCLTILLIALAFACFAVWGVYDVYTWKIRLLQGEAVERQQAEWKVEPNTKTPVWQWKEAK